MTLKMEDIAQNQADIRSYAPSDLVVSNELVGVEVEMEGILNKYALAQMPTFKYWRATEDGSLRDGGIEYIFAAPLAGKDLVSAIRELNTKLDAAKIVPIFSERCSLHVHIDIRNMTFAQFINFVVLATIFEKPLFKLAGTGRERNLFCLSVEEAEADIVTLGKYSKHDSLGDVHHGLRNTSKYSACNISSIFRHGSLEFRHHEGTMNPKRILDWVNILLSLKLYASHQQELPTINSLRKISENGMENFMREVFGRYADALMYRDIEHDVVGGIRNAQDIIFGSELHKIKVKPSLDYYSPESAFMKHMEMKYPEKFATYVKKDGKGTPPNGAEEEMVRILDALGIQII